MPEPHRVFAERPQIKDRPKIRRIRPPGTGQIAEQVQVEDYQRKQKNAHPLRGEAGQQCGCDYPGRDAMQQIVMIYGILYS